MAILILFKAGNDRGMDDIKIKLKMFKRKASELALDDEHEWSRIGVSLVEIAAVVEELAAENRKLTKLAKRADEIIGPTDVWLAAFKEADISREELLEEG